MQSMAIQYSAHYYYAFSPSPQRDLSYIYKCKVKLSPPADLLDRRQSYNTFGFQVLLFLCKYIFRLFDDERLKKLISRLVLDAPFLVFTVLVCSVGSIR